MRPKAKVPHKSNAERFKPGKYKSWYVSSGYDEMLYDPRVFSSTLAEQEIMLSIEFHMQGNSCAENSCSTAIGGNYKDTESN